MSGQGEAHRVAILCLFCDSTGRWRLSVRANRYVWALPLPEGSEGDFIAAGVPLRDDLPAADRGEDGAS